MNSDPDTRQLDPEDLMRNDAWLRPFVQSMIGKGQLVDDVLQETWLTALRRPPAEPGALRSWLAQVARRLALRQLRSDRRRRSHEEGAAQTEALPSTEETVQKFAAQRFVTATVAKLAEPYRTTIILRYHHEIAIREIAERMETTEANVRQRLKRGMDEVRRRCEKEYGKDWRASSALLGLAGLRDAAVAVKTTTPFLIGALLMKPYTSATAVFALVLLAWFSPELTLWFAPSVADDPVARQAVKLPEEKLVPAGPTAREDSERQVVSQTAPDKELSTETVRISGTVYDLKGQPFANVPVGNAVYNAANSTPGDIREPIAEPRFTELGLSDHRGQFEFETSSFQDDLLAGPRFVTIQTSRIWFANQDRGGIVVVVARALKISGTITDEQGRPITDCSVGQSRPEFQDFPIDLQDCNYQPRSGTYADSKGQFELTKVAANGGSISFASPGYDTYWHTEVDREQTNLRIVLRKSQSMFSLRGTVVDHRGQLVANATVGIGEQTTRTDTSGQFEFTVDTRNTHGGSKLHAGKTGLQGWSTAFPEQKIRAQGDKAIEIKLAGPTRQISGRVVHADGSPWPGVLVYPTDLSMAYQNKPVEELSLPNHNSLPQLGGFGSHICAKAKTDGSFSLIGLSDRSYALRVYEQETGFVYDCGDVVAGREDLVLTMPAKLYFDTLQVRVSTRDGRPIAGATLSRYFESYKTASGATRQGVPVGKTDKAGRLTIQNISRHGCVITAEGPTIMFASITLQQHADQGILDIVAPRRAQYRLKLSASRSPSAQVRALDADGNEMPQVVFTGGGNHSRTRVYIRTHRSTGVLTVSEDVTTLVIEKGSRELARVPVTLRPGELTEVVW